MMSARILIPVIAIAFALGGCTGGAPPSEQDPIVEPEVQPPGDVDDGDCLVGTWALDVGAYAFESEQYVLGLGVPLENFAMSGAGELTFTPDGLVAVDMGLRTTGTIVTPETSVPIDVPSEYSATGDWSRAGDETAQFDNWSTSTGSDVLAPETDLPALDFTQLSDIEVDCSTDELYLIGPGAPIGSLWFR